MGQIIGSGYFIEINKDNLEFKYGEQFLDKIKNNDLLGSLLNKFKNSETKSLEKIIEYLINNSSKNRRINQINSFGKIVDLKQSSFTENDVILLYYIELLIQFTFEKYERQNNDSSFIIEKFLHYINSIKPVHTFDFENKPEIENKMYVLDFLTRVAFNKVLLSRYPYYTYLKPIKNFQENIDLIYHSNEADVNQLLAIKRQILGNQNSIRVSVTKLVEYLIQIKNNHKCEYLNSYIQINEIFNFQIFPDYLDSYDPEEHLWSLYFLCGAS